METFLGAPIVMSKEPLPQQASSIVLWKERVSISLSKQPDGTFIGELPIGKKIMVYCVGGEDGNSPAA